MVINLEEYRNKKNKTKKIKVTKFNHSILNLNKQSYKYYKWI